MVIQAWLSGIDLQQPLESPNSEHHKNNDDNHDAPRKKINCNLTFKRKREKADLLAKIMYTFTFTFTHFHGC